MLSFDDDPDWLARLNGEVKSIVRKHVPKKDAPGASSTGAKEAEGRVSAAGLEHPTKFPASGSPLWMIPKISHSAYKTYEKCPKAYQHQYVLMDIERTETEATLWGTQVHTAFEERIRDGKPLPETMKHWEKFAKAFVKMPGEKFVERGVFLDQELNLVPAADSPGVWLKAYIDLMVYNAEKKQVNVIDFKTGNSKYVDNAQLRLYCLLAFKLWPDVQVCKAAYCWLKEDRMGDVMTMDRSEIDGEWSRISEGWGKLDTAFKFGRWPAKRSPLCNYCDVKRQGKCNGR